MNDLKIWYLSTDAFALNATILIDSKLLSKNQLSSVFLENLMDECKFELNKFSDFKHINIEFDFRDFTKEDQIAF